MVVCSSRAMGQREMKNNQGDIGQHFLNCVLGDTDWKFQKLCAQVSGWMA